MLTPALEALAADLDERLGRALEPGRGHPAVVVPDGREALPVAGVAPQRPVLDDGPDRGRRTRRVGAHRPNVAGARRRAPCAQTGWVARQRTLSSASRSACADPASARSRPPRDEAVRTHEHRPGRREPVRVRKGAVGVPELAGADDATPRRSRPSSPASGPRRPPGPRRAGRSARAARSSVETRSPSRFEPDVRRARARRPRASRGSTYTPSLGAVLGDDRARAEAHTEVDLEVVDDRAPPRRRRGTAPRASRSARRPARPSSARPADARGRRWRAGRGPRAVEDRRKLPGEVVGVVDPGVAAVAAVRRHRRARRRRRERSRPSGNRSATSAVACQRIDVLDRDRRCPRPRGRRGRARRSGASSTSQTSVTGSAGSPTECTTRKPER